MQNLLFDNLPFDEHINLLPKDGKVNYFGVIFNESECVHLFNALRESLIWDADQVFMLGQKITTRRKIAWVGDQGCSYKYSGVQKHPQPWTRELLQIKSKVEDMTECHFNSCLLNLYHNGNEGMGWHCDDENELDDQAPIASLSLGGRRKFAFRHKQEKTSISLFLESGSLLMMHSPAQKFWLHSLLKTRMDGGPRINPTFRKIILNDES
jgi:alkylated DNA repair dioxygenase AlkB